MIIKVVFWLCVGLFLYALILITLTHSRKNGISYEDILENSDDSLKKDIPLRPRRHIQKYSKTELARCANSIGRFGFDVSNPICVKNIHSNYLNRYILGMVFEDQNITGYLAVSICWCQNLPNKPVYKFAVSYGKGKFLTMFFVEDGITELPLYPSHCMDEYSHEIIRNGGHIMWRDNILCHWNLLRDENKQQSMPILKEKFFSVSPKRKENETQEAFDKRMQSAIKKKQFLDEYLAFTKRGESK